MSNQFDGKWLEIQNLIDEGSFDTAVTRAMQIPVSEDINSARSQAFTLIADLVDGHGKALDQRTFSDDFRRQQLKAIRLTALDEESGNPDTAEKIRSLLITDPTTQPNVG